MIAWIPWIFLFLTGICVGSFLNVCIYRIPREESIVFGPSHCMTCGHKLGWADLVPVFSFLFLRGRCRYCKAELSLQYPLIEVTNALLWLICYYRFGDSVRTVFACGLASILLVISVIDERTQIIPLGCNIGIVLLATLKIIVEGIQTSSFEVVPYLIGGISVSGFLLLVLMVTGGEGIGGGDVKLMAAAGIFLGFPGILLAFLIGCVAGTILHVFRMVVMHAGRRLALGPYLSFGIFVAMLYGGDLLNWYLGLLGIR